MSIKSYQATLRTFWNGQKVPNILPLLINNNELITEFEAKANIFDKYFGDNNSVLPSILNHLTDDKHFFRSYFQLIKNLDPNKAHVHDEISV